MQILELILALSQPPWPLGYYVIVFVLIGGNLSRMGVDNTICLFVAGVLCWPVGWAMARLAGWLFKRLIDRALAPNKKRVVLLNDEPDHRY